MPKKSSVENSKLQVSQQETPTTLPKSNSKKTLKIGLLFPKRKGQRLPIATIFEAG